MNENHLRRCWDCGNIATHESSIAPGVLCKKCGSQDTRKVRVQQLPVPTRSSTETLIAACKELAATVQCDDGIANSALREIAERLETYHNTLIEIRDSKFTSYENTYTGQYGLGVCDGHRYCAILSKEAI
jgi:DNA-directed RNA polymerase subunit RPC12/RpoP